MRHLPIIATVALGLAGCGPLSRLSEPPEVAAAVPAEQVRKVVCPSVKVVRYRYDPRDPANSDTPETVRQTRENNAALRAMGCGAKSAATK